MWKKLRYTIYFIIIFAVFAAAYNIRSIIISPYIEKYLFNITGHNIDINSFYISPLKRGFVLTDIKIDNALKADRVLFSFSISQIIKNIKKPLLYIKQVEIDNVIIDPVNYKPPQTAKDHLKDKDNTPISFFNILAADIIVNKITLKSFIRDISFKDTNISFYKDNIGISSFIYPYELSDENFEMNLKISKTDDDNILNSGCSIMSTGEIDAFITVKGEINLSNFDFNQDILIKKFEYRNSNINNSSGSIVKSGNKIITQIDGDFGKIFSEIEDLKNINASSVIDFQKINSDLSGKSKASFSMTDKKGDLDIEVDNLNVLGLDLGSFDIVGTFENEIANIIFTYADKHKIESYINRAGDYRSRIIVKDKKIGNIIGNYKNGSIKADIIKAPLVNMPFMPLITKNTLEGTITIEGSIEDNYGKIKVDINDFKTSKIGKTDISGILAKQADMYVINFYKSDNTVVFNTVIDSGQVLSTDFKFVNTDLTNVLRAFGYTQGSFKGVASGRIIYEKGGITSFDIKAYDGIIYDNYFSRLEAKGDINSQRVNINQFMLKGKNNETNAYLYGLLGFTKDNPISFLNARLRDIKLSGMLVNSDIIFNGNLKNKNEIHGKIESNNIDISGISFKNFSANTIITSQSIDISNLKAENGLSGNFQAGFSKITGIINLKNTDISGIVADLSGLLNSTISISGTPKKAYVNIFASVKKGKYSGLPFNFSSEIEYKDSLLNIKKANINSERSRIFMHGEYSSKGKVYISIENLSELIINKFIGFRTPLKGEFSGKGTLTEYKGKSKFNLNLKGDNIYVKDLKLNDVKSDLEIYNDKITLSKSSAKISDSEFMSNKGSFDIKSGKYDLDIFLVNAHIGPTDIFGKIDISGIMKQKKGGSNYTGKIEISNFWINKYKLSKLDLNYFLENKKINIYKENQQDNSLKFNTKVSFGNETVIEELNISKNNAIFNLNATFNKDNFKIVSKGNDLDWSFLSDILELPISIEGKTNIKINSEGSYKNLNGILDIKSNQGSLIEIPYDTMDITVEVKNNSANIKSGKIFKKNEIDIEVKGSFPFWIDSTIDKRMMKEKVNIEYDIIDSKLNILKYLSDGFFNPRTGKGNIKGHISGTYENIINNAQLNITGGSFDSKAYFDRFKDLNVDISLNNNQATINRFTCKSGSGKLNISGMMQLEGFNISNFNIRFLTDKKGIPLKVPDLPMPGSLVSKGIFKDFSSGEPRFDLLLKGSLEKPKISGWVVLENTRFSFPPPDNSGETDFPENLEIDIDLISAKNTKFENSNILAWLNGKLNLKGLPATLVSSGVLDIKRGNINYLGINFDIVNAKVEIIENELFISAEAETIVFTPGESESETIRMVIDRSSLDALNLRFYSKDDPTMDSQKALAKITKTEQAVKHSDQSLTGLSDFALRQQALRLIDSNLATPIARTFLRKTGIVDNLKVTYVATDEDNSVNEEVGFADLLYGTKYSLEKNLTNQLLLGYSVTIDQIEKKLDLKHEIEMRYRLSNNLFLSGSYELESETSLHRPDRRLMFEHRIRFGLPNPLNRKTRGKQLE